MAEKLVPFDMARYLDSEEALAEYLTQVLADGAILTSYSAPLATLPNPKAWPKLPRMPDWGAKAFTRRWPRL